MSSKYGPDSRPKPSWSLAIRLTVWYAGATFVLIVVVVGFLYWILSRSLDRQNDNQMADQVRVLRDLLTERPGDLVAVRQEAEEEFQSRQHTQVYVRLLDATGKVLVETPGMAELIDSSAFPAAADFGSGEDRRSSSGTSLRVMSIRVTGGSEYIVQTAVDRSSDAELLAEYRRSLWLVLAAGMAVCALVGYQIAHRGLRLVRLVADTARRIDPTNLTERIEANGLPADLLDLADTFNRMLDRLERSFTRLGQFSADIAHELRTPLNNLRGEVEVALGKPRTPEQYQELLASNLEECGRLARLIESLLFLARAENPRTHANRDVVDIGTELATVCEFYEATAGEKNVTLSVTVSGQRPTHLNRTLFQRAICNLVENALAHTPPGGGIALATADTEAATVVTVTDTGAGISTAHLPHVFDRFYRADQARTSEAGHVGLGLPIVKSIVDLHGGTVEIASAEGKGTCVTMTFPRKPAEP
ncbi:histidine kinase : Histidine kinase OS=Hyphomicrobium denitrificans 1NES1 GN=HYPDE_40403 PE=4 SV=1: 2CSK_N: HAMP: HisKA: HATPase_c [Gemmata massiliana]|uniref:histidine kinase n=1 Tax=Gemmata massiliana TaxID=1210884 RepID=A0A6P2DHP1_9BACT|nr:heavy metal sensor histidine kinase [Gemmata massiliana]VTS01470.1 histidine kinase : Histidine kinase OS=Hyphomicrobium denitrificans 1NES1 GN=HYPDE_40403 PE=4 SV=1: 2CSK_N: HAMP: HisKA: HATPase_c [Gemmata massiliana]